MSTLTLGHKKKRVPSIRTVFPRMNWKMGIYSLWVGRASKISFWRSMLCCSHSDPFILTQLQLVCGPFKQRLFTRTIRNRTRLLSMPVTLTVDLSLPVLLTFSCGPCAFNQRAVRELGLIWTSYYDLGYSHTFWNEPWGSLPKEKHPLVNS